MKNEQAREVFDWVVAELRQRLPEEFEYRDRSRFYTPEWVTRYGNSGGGVSVEYAYRRGYFREAHGVSLTVSGVASEVPVKTYAVRQVGEIKPIEQAVALCLKRQPRAKELYDRACRQMQEYREQLARIVSLLSAEGLDVMQMTSFCTLDENGELAINVRDSHFCDLSRITALFDILGGDVKVSIDRRLNVEQWRRYQAWKESEEE